MDEGARNPEKKIVVSDLFPIKQQSITAALGELNLDEERRMLSNDNRHVFDSFEELRESHREDKAKQSLLGNLICYCALREEARSRGGVLPRLTKQFVHDYDEEKEKDVQNELLGKKLSKNKVGQQIRRAKVVMFRNFEPEFSRIIEEKFGDQPNWRPENDSRYSGVINLYLMFRAGCGDLKKFSKNIS